MSYEKNLGRLGSSTACFNASQNASHPEAGSTKGWMTSGCWPIFRLRFHADEAAGRYYDTWVPDPNALNDKG